MARETYDRLTVEINEVEEQLEKNQTQEASMEMDSVQDLETIVAREKLELQVLSAVIVGSMTVRQVKEDALASLEGERQELLQVS